MTRVASCKPAIGLLPLDLHMQVQVTYKAHQWNVQRMLPMASILCGLKHANVYKYVWVQD